jgi:hypothetical protein
LSGLFAITGGLDAVVNQVGNVVYEQIEMEQESKYTYSTFFSLID